MKTAIAYVSTHHGNTKKLLDAIAAENEITLIDASTVKEADLNGYELIGFASGIAFGKYYPEMLEFIKKNLPENKRVFFIHTAGDPRESHNGAAKAICEERGCKCAGTYFCKGFDTYGPFKLMGGIAKGHPDAKEIAGAVEFYRNLKDKCSGEVL